MPQSLHVEHLGEDTVCIAPFGDLDLDGADGLAEEIRRIEDEPPGTLVVDLRGVRFLDSSGLGRLVALAQWARQRGVRTYFVRGPRPVSRLFALTRAGAGVEWLRSPDQLRLAGPA